MKTRQITFIKFRNMCKYLKESYFMGRRCEKGDKESDLCKEKRCPEFKKLKKCYCNEVVMKP